MNNKEILDLINVLSVFKLNKLNDEIADVVLNNLTKLVPYNEAFLKVQEQLRKFTFETIDRERLESFEVERLELAKASNLEKPIKESALLDKYQDVFTQQSRFNKAITNYLLKDVSLELDKIDYKAFIKDSKDLGIDITYQTLETLKPMLNNFNSSEIEVSENDIQNLLN